jgi:hypothetical protein
VSHKIIAGVVVTHDKLSPVLLLLAIYYRRCRCYRGGKNNHRYHGIYENPRQGLITGVNDTSD